MEIQEETYVWCASCGLDLKIDKKDTQFVRLAKDSSDLFINGVYVEKILDDKFNIQVKGIKDDKLAAIKLANWNILVPAIAKLGISISHPTKTLIIAGDYEKISELIKQLYIYEASISQVAKPRKLKKVLNVESVKLDKQLIDASTSLEFIVLSMCHSFNITAKQSVGLLTQDNRYLSQIMIRGLKGNSYEPVTLWVQDLYHNSDHLASLVTDDATSLPVILNVMKTGFSSKDLVTIKWMFRLVTKFTLEFTNPQLLVSIEEWVLENLMNSLSMAYYRFYGELADTLVEFILSVISTEQLNHTFLNVLQNCINSTTDYYSFSHEIFIAASKNEGYLEELEHSGTLLGWIQHCANELANADSEGWKISAINFLSDLFLIIMWRFGENENFVSTYIELLSKECKNESQMWKINAYAQFFTVIDRLADVKSEFTMVFYKTWIFLLIENFTDEIVWEFILQNFKLILNQKTDIPVNILVGPLINRLFTEEDIQPVYIELLQTISWHGQIQLKSILTILDFYAKVFMNNEGNTKLVFKAFGDLVTKYIKNDQVGKFAEKLVKLALLRVKKTSEEQFSIASYRAKNLIKLLFALNNIYLNVAIQSILVTILEQSSGSRLARQFFISQLKLFGDPQDLLEAPVSKSVDVGHRSARIQALDKYEERVNIRALQQIEQAKQRRKSIEKRNQARSVTRMERFEKIRRKLQPNQAKSRVFRSFDNSDTKPIQLTSRSSRPQFERVVKIRHWQIPEEQETYELVQIILRRFRRVWSYLFSLYHSTGAERKGMSNISDFDYIADRKKRLNKQEVNKLCVDYGIIPNLIKQEQFLSMYNQFCIQFTKTSDRANIEYANFAGFMAQIAYFAYVGEHPVISISNLVLYMRNKSLDLGKSTDIYDDPDPGTGDKEVCKRLTAEFSANPDLKIPDGYVLASEKNLQVSYDLEFPNEQNYIAYAILDEIVYNSLKFRLLQPTFDIVQRQYVKGVKKERLPNTFKLSPDMKLQVEKSEDPKTASEVATVLEDLFRAVSDQSSKVIARGKVGQVENRFKQQLQQEREQEEQMKMEKERKRRHRSTLLSKQLDDYHSEMAALAAQQQAIYEQNRSKEQEKEERKKQKELQIKNQRSKTIQTWKQQKEAGSLRKKFKVGFGGSVGTENDRVKWLAK